MVYWHQPECNFLHGFFRCKLPVEVVDIEVKIISIQGMHIFRKDRMTQLIKCTPWSTRLCLHPTIIKKMKTFLEVEGKMGPIPVPVPGNQFRPPLPETNPNVRKNDVAEKRKRATPNKKFRPAAPNLLQCTLPYQRLNQSPRIVHPYLQYQQEKTPHGPAQVRCWETFLRTEIGYSLRTNWPLKTKVRMQPVFLVHNPL